MSKYVTDKINWVRPSSYFTIGRTAKEPVQRKLVLLFWLY